MQGFKALVLLAVVVALLGLVSAAAVEGEPSGVQQLPAMLVRSGPAQLSDPAARSCTNSACYSLCRSLGWANGFCLDAEWCLCYN
ncbi:hypothetical protein MSG28_012039 [Choristoneura fumiferana]|uniref:Uncharacterized protein n=1 Tax=Choristoneura fumiferana TaxID=7141 RepID=A0ACC0KP37_CHOFU|nr:hypothetical protein MSG28_012039 [Choristoneura fumiferana]